MLRRLFRRSLREQLEDRLTARLGTTVGAVALFFLEVVQILIISAAIIIPIRYFLIQPFYVKGASMEPSYYDHEYLIIDELSYFFREPMRGEVVVFRYPRDPDQYFIKRVIGLPGETVEINNEQVVIYNDDYPNGIVLDEDYLAGEITSGKKRTTLTAGEYYLLGDNRDASLDSRSFGAVEDGGIVGRVWLRGYPFSRLSIFDLPYYNL